MDCPKKNLWWHCGICYRKVSRKCLSKNGYSSYTFTISRAPVPVDMKMEKAFMAMQMKIRNRHSEMHDNIKSVLSRHSIQDGSLLPAVLNNFYRSRIGIRMLVDHHMAIQQFEPGYTGIIQSKCTCSSIIHSVMDSIRKECGQSFSKVPTFTTEYHTDGSLTYIPKHVELITSEVLKFALLSSTENPNISIQLSSGSSGAVIKVSYKGNGIPYHQVPQVFSYLGSPSSSKVHDPVASDTDKRLGDLNSFDPFGMPIARQYARFFHGDLCVLPMEGHGVDVFIYLPDLG